MKDKETYNIAPGDAGISVVFFQSSLVAPAPLSMVVDMFQPRIFNEKKDNVKYFSQGIGKQAFLHEKKKS